MKKGQRPLRGIKPWAPLTVLFFILFLSCSAGDTAKRDTLIIGLESSPINLDPRFATDANSSRAIQILFNNLVRLDPNSNIIPDLAERWKAPDDKTYLFFLKKGVKFHDGRELTAEDVRYTFESLKDPNNASPHREAYEVIERVEALDKYTVRFILKGSFAPFLTNMVMGIVPKHVAEEKGKEFAYNPVGTGPFRFERWIPDDKIEFIKNDDYFEGAPKLKGVIFKIIPEDTVRLLELKKGSVDFIQNAIPPDSIPSLIEDRNLKVLTGEGTSYSYMGFNMTDPILKKVKVREAIAHAIDRKAIIEHLLGGLATPASGLFTPSYWAYEPRIKTYDFDPDRAKRLLNEAGYPDPDGNGPRSRFKLTYKTTNNELRKRIAEVFQQQLKEVGIDVEIKTYEWGTFYSDIKKGNFQIYTLTWVGITDPDIYYNIFHSSSIPPKGSNRGRYLNATLDRLLEKGRSATGHEGRKDIYSNVQRIVSEDLPYISLWHTKNIVAMKNDIKGFVLYPSGDFTSLKSVWR